MNIYSFFDYRLQLLAKLLEHTLFVVMTLTP
jgi:hypothetical protein